MRFRLHEAYEQITGYGRTDVIGCTARLIKTHLTPERTYRSMRKALGRGESWSGIFTNRKQSGEIWHSSISITPFRIAGDT
ncbi:PAS domain S-box protein [Paenibacillus hamazuiensis]|uniref:PAS domain S-box protein n=1 Tax=Paenibacillus hamazuiensis TaxID=2936508 RepID=UPI00200CA3FA|nr:PAS domain S-box protein [Paenibacillus hamazuiensis]